MTGLVVITEDDAFALAIQALTCAELAVTCVHVEEAVAAARHDRPDVLAVDTDRASIMAGLARRRRMAHGGRRCGSA